MAVPSRHYYTLSKEKPLNGYRIAIKDIYDLNGLRTAASNRAYRDVYPARNRTANVIQRLIHDGAIIVGKTKTTTFADRELATKDWIDTHSPFNPRGDGYIWGGGSSTGSATAIAAYDWLDFAIGSDSRFPCSVLTHALLQLTIHSKPVGVREVRQRTMAYMGFGLAFAQPLWMVLSLVACA